MTFVSYLFQLAGLGSEVFGAFLLASSYLAHLGPGTGTRKGLVLVGAIFRTVSAKQAAEGAHINPPQGIDLLQGLSLLIAGFILQIFGIVLSLTS